MILHVDELHECGGRRKQPEAIWGVMGKSHDQGSLGFIGMLGRWQSPGTQKS